SLSGGGGRGSVAARRGARPLASARGGSGRRMLRAWLSPSRPSGEAPGCEASGSHPDSDGEQRTPPAALGRGAEAPEAARSADAPVAKAAAEAAGDGASQQLAASQRHVVGSPRYAASPRQMRREPTVTTLPLQPAQQLQLQAQVPVVQVQRYPPLQAVQTQQPPQQQLAQALQAERAQSAQLEE
ncbi:unnamed protein product, partial [Prorocentrum cordatum]